VFADVALARRIERAEAVMSVAMVGALGRRAGGGVFVESVGEGYAIYGGPGSPFNKMIGAGLEGEAIDDAALDRAERVFREHGAGPRAEVSVLANPTVFEAFHRRGYRFETVEHVLGIALPASSATVAREGQAAVVSPAHGEEDVRAWMDVLVGGFAAPDATATGVSGDSFPEDVLRDAFSAYNGVEDFRRYLASVDDQVAGGGGMYMSQGVGILCGAATLPQFRRRGVQGALLRRRLEDAAAAGCTLAVVTTAPGSRSQQNAHRHGFALLYARAVLTREG
jgi:GNAT superfamily N-acetyltransferase